MKPKVSIIIIHFQAKKELFNLIQSIKSTKPRLAYEIIVVDNDNYKKLEKDLKIKFPQVKYYRSESNIGFGAANNFAVKKAQGDLLLFLNPDVIIRDNSIDDLYRKYLMENPGILAPQALDVSNKIHLHQCTNKLTPTKALVTLSFINKIFPDNPISRKFWISDWDRKSERQVEFVEGSAFMMAKKLFTEIGGFDENFFLFFEDTDLCKRVRDRGLKIIYYPKAKLIHLGGKSTINKEKSKKIFQQSRKYYFKKHYGFLKSFVVNLFLTSLENISFLKSQ